MKINRYKKVKKFLNFYINNYNFRQPYQLLLDGTFCLAALANHVNIADNIPNYLQAELKLLTTQCAIIEVEKFERKSLAGPLQILKQSHVHKCGHGKAPLSGSDCFLSMVADGNPSHYIVATQDSALQKLLRLQRGVPLLYLHAKAPVLDPPSRVSNDFAARRLTGGVLDADKSRIDDMKGREGLAHEQMRKRRKRRGVNPLSCKKKKKRGNCDGKVTGDVVGVVRKSGVKVRIAKHVKMELSKSEKD